MKSSRVTSAVMLSPAVIVVSLVVGIPLVFNGILAFTDASAMTGFMGSRLVGLDNFANVFGGKPFQASLILTIGWTTVTLVGELLIGLTLALALHDGPRRLTRVLQALWLLPWVIPSAAAFYVWRLLFNPTVGPFHATLTGLELIDRPVLSDPALAFWAVTIAAVWKGFPFYMLLFYAALQSVPRDLYDAAKVDGARRRVVFWRVERPHLYTVGAVATTLGFIWTFNWITPVFIMTEGGPGVSTRTLGLFVYEEAINGFRYATAATAALALVIVVTVVVVVAHLARRRTERMAS